jgi:hypothetical protein
LLNPFNHPASLKSVHLYAKNISSLLNQQLFIFTRNSDNKSMDFTPLISSLSHPPGPPMAPHDLGASGYFRYGTLKLKGLECKVLSYVEWMDRWTVEIPVKDQKGKNLVVARSLQGRRVEVQEPGLMANSLVFDGKSEENAGNHPKRWD